MNRLERALSEKPFQLFVSLPRNEEALANAAFAEGADGLKVHMNVHHRASGNSFGPLANYLELFTSIRSQFDGPFGIVPAGSPQDLNPAELAQLSAIGIDFISIYGHHLPAAQMRIEGVASTFAIDDQFDWALLDSMKHFPMTALEASIVPGAEYGTPLVFTDLLKYRLLVEKAGIPVMVPTQRKVVPADIPALRDTGVRVLLAGAMALGTTTDEIKRSVAALRNAIDK
ncbi:hypothetical protein [Brevibacillus centrosporus]|uniref:Thiamine-phosphate pyrophosphorylase n=1 Tax=Brevibacillus centrosporus TaxID=54910 RepID=A0A1I3M7B3_9BACL|nr:hypothetical protein [Brevibacillus centrosporus]MEC2131254.1 hypothetical protein [Brevibacillus centrosporus]RNB72709.1 hypothetical protein EDM55_05820 [Brevibacillus centrosporus]SFI92625.1 hypothetical protein SAMN05518846_101534 [Brevibacillus centrosporus]